MKHLMNKTLIAAAMTAALSFVATSAIADTFVPFTVAEGSVTGTPTNTFEAGKVIGNYIEDVTLNADGTFTTKLLFNASTFGDTNGGSIGTSFLSSAQTPFASANQYAIYAVLTGSGTFSPTAVNGNNFTFNSGGSLVLSLDPNSDTQFTKGTGSIGVVASPDDVTLATGQVVSGGGTLKPCTGIDCGSFNTNTSFILQTAGLNFFTAPRPFYNMLLTSGQFDKIDFTKIGVVQRTTGSLDATFGSVPEPESIALMGVGLLGLGLSMRRRKQA